MNQILPIFVCCVMPVLIVLIVSVMNMYQTRQKAILLEKVIEKDGAANIEGLTDLFRKPKRTLSERLMRHLLIGCILSFIGLILIICGVVAWADGMEFGADPVIVPMMFGGISLAIGASYLIVYFVMRRRKEELSEEQKN